jgi:biotin carboxylase
MQSFHKTHQSDYFWIIGGGILQKPIIKEAKLLGYNIIVTDLDKDCICAPEADIFEAIDVFDIDAHIRFSNHLIQKGLNIVGVLAAGIDAPETMASLAKHLSLPGVDVDIAHLVNNKELFRQKMLEIGVDVPNFYIISEKNLSNLDKIISKVGFPLIVKNTSSSGSRGTKIFYEYDFPSIKMMVLEAIKVSRSSKALIESVWTGSEHTVETLYDVDGKFHECFITDRVFDKSSGFAIETGLIHPSRLNYHDQEDMYALARQVSDLLGIKIGASKFDMILTDQGPKIIEMTVRLSGGFDCQFLVPAATEKNILKAAILTAVGLNFNESLLEDKLQKTCISESLWPDPGIITDIQGLDKIDSCAGVELVHFRFNIGDNVTEYNNCTQRVCFLLVSGKDLDEAKKNMESLKKIIKITTNTNENN